MSTRANYIFKSGRKTLATFYIHHDGYPEGAAEYFHKALIFGDGKINSPDDFLRANEACEISCIHSDIEYLYEFDTKTQRVKVYKISINALTNKQEENLIIIDSIYAFINDYQTVFSSSKRFHDYKIKYSWKNEEEVKKIIKAERAWCYISAQDRYDYEVKLKPKCLDLVYKNLRKATEELIEDAMRFGIDNPNYKHLVAYQHNLMKQLEELIKNND